MQKEIRKEKVINSNRRIDTLHSQSNCQKQVNQEKEKKLRNIKCITTNAQTEKFVEREIESKWF